MLINLVIYNVKSKRSSRWKTFCLMQLRNQWLNVSNNYIIDCTYKILLKILCVKNYNHILVVHLISKWWHGKRNDGIIFSLQVFIHMASMIDDKLMWMSKISFENVTKIQSFQIWLKNNYANNMDKMICH
jgi:hypothetical protein